jgi:glycosyltransferase involved in cell wall biosynthesis
MRYAGLVSVIIPAFNAAKYIRQTLNSALTQTYQELEVIVVDDGSSDATASIVEEFVKKDARVQLVKQCNAGVGAARNTVIRMARGEYIAPLDADDIWFPEKLEKQVACMEQYGRETGLVYCWARRVNEDGESEGMQDSSAPEGPCHKAEGRLRHAMVFRNIVDNASVPLFRRAALARVGLYLTRAEQGGAQGCEDWDLSMRIAETFSIRVVPEYLLAYRQSGSSLSANVESMASSFAVVSRRARQRNGDLPAATFRWSAGYFYQYLVGKSDLGEHHSWRFRYLKKAVCANPWYLLKPGTYKNFIKFSLNMATGSTSWKKFLKRVRPSSDKKGQEDILNGKSKRKRPFISNRIFEHVECRRLYAELQDQVLIDRCPAARPSASGGCAGVCRRSSPCVAC